MVTLQREAPGDPPQLQIEVGPDCITMRSMTRDHDPGGDVTWYSDTVILRGHATTMILTVNCGAPQPYFEIKGEQSSGAINYRVRVPITHDEQHQILSLADPLSEIAHGSLRQDKRHLMGVGS